MMSVLPVVVFFRDLCTNVNTALWYFPERYRIVSYAASLWYFPERYKKYVCAACCGILRYFWIAWTISIQNRMMSIVCAAIFFRDPWMKWKTLSTVHAVRPLSFVSRTQP